MLCTARTHVVECPKKPGACNTVPEVTSCLCHSAHWGGGEVSLRYVFSRLQAVEIVAQAMTTDADASFTDPINAIGADMTARATQQGGAVAPAASQSSS